MEMTDRIIMMTFENTTWIERIMIRYECCQDQRHTITIVSLEIIKIQLAHIQYTIKSLYFTESHRNEFIPLTNCMKTLTETTENIGTFFH